MKVDYKSEILKKAAALGDDGFSRQAINIDRNSGAGLQASWTEIVASGYVAPKFGGSKEKPLVLTDKGREFIGLEPSKP